MAGFLGTVKNRQGVIAAAAVGAVCALAAGAGWYVYGPSLSPPRTPAASTTSGPAPMAANDAQGTAAASKGTNGTDLAPAPATGASAAPPASGAPSSADAEGKPQPPEFDIVRVERSGEGVIAGRGAPGATIVLKDGDNELARAVADANGEVVFLPPPLTPGEHALTLQSTLPGAGAGASSQSVKVVVPKAGQQAVTVARAAPEQPAASRSDAGAPKSQPGTPSSAAAPPKPAPAVSIRTAEAEEGGSFYATGSAPPGSQSRLYLNGAFVGKVIADLNGLWSLKVEKGMQPGHYAVRADEVEAGSGKVIARAEVPFDFPVAAPTGPVSSPATPVKGPVDQAQKSSVEASAKDQPKAQPASSPSGGTASAPGPAAAVVKEVRTATVVRGDSLWRISKKMLGRGTRYTQIYEANASQIRNPSLVFPGQVFVLPPDPG
jgi:nucleoid-associated protein YgaU